MHKIKIRKFKCKSIDEAKDLFFNYFPKALNVFICNSFIYIYYARLADLEPIINVQLYKVEGAKKTYVYNDINIKKIYKVLFERNINFNLIYMNEGIVKCHEFSENKYGVFFKEYPDNWLEQAGVKKRIQKVQNVNYIVKKKIDNVFSIKSGSCIEIENLLTGEVEKYKLVTSHYDVKPQSFFFNKYGYRCATYKEILINDHSIENGEISIKAPFAKKLLGHKNGDKVYLPNKDGEIKPYQIISIN